MYFNTSAAKRNYPTKNAKLGRWYMVFASKVHLSDLRTAILEVDVTDKFHAF